jgi:hypothetical protein
MGDERTEWIEKKTTKAAKKLKESERSIVDDDISKCATVKDFETILRFYCTILKVRIRSVVGLLMTIIV